MNVPTSNLPMLDMSTSTTGCCPKFDPTQWDRKVFVFNNKSFIQDRTVSFMHIPLNMGKVMTRMQKVANDNEAVAKDFILLSQDASPWHADHFYAASKDIPDAQMVWMTGKYYAKVYEGEFKDAVKWHQDLIDTVSKDGNEVRGLYFYYTTCPNCGKAYGKNYVVGLAQIA